MNDFKYKLYADCVIVNGAVRNLIYDLCRRRYFSIPDALVDLLTGQFNSVNEVKDRFSDEDSIKIVDEYFDFLKKEELIFFIPNQIEDRFPSLENVWDSPSILSNALICISSTSKYSLKELINQLIEIDCLYLQFYSDDYITEEIIDNIIQWIKGSRIKSIEFIFKYNMLQNDNELQNLLIDEPRIKALIFHSAEQNELQNSFEDKSMGNYVFVTQKIDHSKSFLNNSLQYMNVNHYLFFESQKHHAYFNGKVAIDKEGNIKNCTTHHKSFGNIGLDKIKNIVSSTEFQRLWNVPKDQTKVCKDCEFRYMCIDSRVPKQISENEWGHDVECNYNPYIAKWKDEEGYVTIKELNNTKQVTNI